MKMQKLFWIKLKARFVDENQIIACNLILSKQAWKGLNNGNTDIFSPAW